MALWSVGVEGEADVAVVAAILRATGHELGSVHGRRGKAFVDLRAKGWCEAARYSPWLVLRDLDHDAGCAPELLGSIRRSGASGVMRIAVRAVEAWLLADRERVASWLGVARSKVPPSVEDLEDPKATLVGLARSSRIRAVREDVVPVGTARIGPGYVHQVRIFCAESWRPRAAAATAPSLARCLAWIERQQRN